MKQSDPLELVEPGSLAPPGPLGRGVRFMLGAGCLWAVWQVIQNIGPVVASPITATLHLPLAMLMAMALWIINYVVNIGFSRSWGRRPASLSLVGYLALALVGLALNGDADGPILGVPLFAWLVYFYSHLGLSFVLAGLMATPGCEMRAIPALVGRMIHRPSAEHQCPGFIATIDDWERRRCSKGEMA
ncbi:MAG: hypothetical protein E2O58_10280 [Gammaproteobacteria bacterium]|nr:MAG: hypothetical protein E2O58_10280 [Gammaproteobacteria bacterium]